jgi:hypothetical protein
MNKQKEEKRRANTQKITGRVGSHGALQGFELHTALAVEGQVAQHDGAARALVKGAARLREV